MQWQWFRFDDLGVHALYDVLALRSRVFVMEQGPFEDADGFDQCSWHLLGRDAAGRLQAYLRVVDPGQKYPEPSIGRVVTSPEVRGKGVGQALMREGLRGLPARWPGQGVRISAQARLRNFYAVFGFVPSGDVYLEDGIDHLEMACAAPSEAIEPVGIKETQR